MHAKKHCSTCEWFVFDKYCDLDDRYVSKRRKACTHYHKREGCVVAEIIIKLLYFLLVGGFVALKAGVFK